MSPRAAARGLSLAINLSLQLQGVTLRLVVFFMVLCLTRSPGSRQPGDLGSALAPCGGRAPQASILS